MRNKDPEATAAAYRALSECVNARNFPENTCPASRHVQLAAEVLVKDGHYHGFQEEPHHIATSMLTVVAELYKARTRLAELEGKDSGEKA